MREYTHKYIRTKGGGLMGTERLLALATEADRNSWGGALLQCRVAKLEIAVNIV